MEAMSLKSARPPHSTFDAGRARGRHRVSLLQWKPLDVRDVGRRSVREELLFS